jgi:lipopolysaccharide transport system permease protein
VVGVSFKFPIVPQARYLGVSLPPVQVVALRIESATLSAERGPWTRGPELLQQGILEMMAASGVSSDSRAQPVVIEPSRSFMPLEWRDIWAYRDLLAILTLRDVSVRYKQSLIGVGWVILQPLATAALFTLIFGRFARLPSDGIPYPVFTFCALLPWNYFARALTDSSNSLVGATNLVTKVYFPRLILPLSRTLAGLVDFVVSFAMLLAMMVWYGIWPTWRIALVPLFLAPAMAAALAVGLWLTALNVRYRDIGFVVPFLAQFWMYATPVAYSSSIVPAAWRWAYGLNPMVGVIEGFRWALLGQMPPDAAPMFASLACVLPVLVGGLYYFRSAEQTVADFI